MKLTLLQYVLFNLYEPISNTDTMHALSSGVVTLLP